MNKRTQSGLCVVCVMALVAAAYNSWQGFVVKPDGLDYLKAQWAPNGAVVLVGAWDAPGGSYLNQARHAIVGGSTGVTLYHKPTLTKSRIFHVWLPVGLLPVVAVNVKDPSGTVKTIPINGDYPGNPFSAIQVDSEPE